MSSKASRSNSSNSSPGEQPGKLLEGHHHVGVSRLPLESHPTNRVETEGVAELGQPVTRNNAGHLWRRATKKLDGLPEDAGGWHSLRHFYASVLILAGESVKAFGRRPRPLRP